MYRYFDLHRHDQFSHDAYGSAYDCVKRAGLLMYDSLGVSNHGTIDGLIDHARACKDHNLKPILGCELNVMVYNSGKPSHLCVFCKNYNGYENLFKMFEETTVVNNKQVITFDVLVKYHEDLICTTACLSSEISREILCGRFGAAKKLLYRLKKIFNDDLYVEIIPYDVDNRNTQLRVNLKLIELANQLNIKCILTSDSHTCRTNDGLRCMPSEHDIRKQFTTMFYKRFDNVHSVCDNMLDNLVILSDSVELFDV